MKFPVAYYLLVLYCSVMVRCALPVMCDAFSHIFNEEQHIATVHAIYGSNHLQAEVANTVADNKSSHQLASVQQDNPTVIHTFPQGYNSNFIVGMPFLFHSDFSIYRLSAADADCINPPPEHS